jgi:hypothetical protein
MDLLPLIYQPLREPRVAFRLENRRRDRRRRRQRFGKSGVNHRTRSYEVLYGLFRGPRKAMKPRLALNRWLENPFECAIERTGRPVGQSTHSKGYAHFCLLTCSASIMAENVAGSKSREGRMILSVSLVKASSEPDLFILIKWTVPGTT